MGTMCEHSDDILVHCPRCDRRAKIDARSGVDRLTCSSCGFAKEAEPPPTEARQQFAIYNGTTILGARLWLDSECCGGRRLWALNERHLAYLEAFVRSSNRTRDFPSPPGSRQLADRLPTWMIEAKHRDEVLRTLARLRETL